MGLLKFHAGDLTHRHGRGSRRCGSLWVQHESLIMFGKSDGRKADFGIGSNGRSASPASVHRVVCGTLHPRARSDPAPVRRQTAEGPAGALRYVRHEFHVERPLIEQAFQTDRRDLFVERYAEMINASREGQQAMKEIDSVYLQRIERDTRGLPITLYPSRKPPSPTPRRNPIHAWSS